VSAHDAVVAFARDLVEEIAAGMAVELATTQGSSFAPAPAPPQARQPRNPIMRGAAAVHPHLGQHLARLPGDTISGHAYQHLGMFPPGV
jgi:hypothetical protein